MAVATIPSSAGPATPDWLNAAAAKGDAVPEPERIALRTAPPSRAVPEPKMPETLSRINRIESPAEPTAERDLDRPRYPSRVMAPETAVMMLVAAIWIKGVVPYLPTMLQTFEVYISIPGALGLFQLVRGLFRFFGGGYRLTARQILRTSPGPIADPEPIDLATIATVKVERTRLEGLLCAGSIRLSFERDIEEDIVLGPVGWPGRRAKLIEEAVQNSRAANVVTGRVGA